MPVITCDFHLGRTREQKRKLAMDLTDAVAEATGSRIDNVFVIMREIPGFDFVDTGEDIPDYVPGPYGLDLDMSS
jgi:4-oxalocrotonate tautomerase family enzyme